MIQKIGFGGGCHWCTEAVFQSLIGVEKVEQGWISAEESQSFSEAIIVHFNPSEISLVTLIEIHLHTHSCTSIHSMRKKYRSAVYVWNVEEKEEINKIIQSFQSTFDRKIITTAYTFSAFRENEESYQNYYYNNPKKAFCKNYIEPKIQYILNHYSKHSK